jgi:hypothetical protein
MIHKHGQYFMLTVSKGFVRAIVTKYLIQLIVFLHVLTTTNPLNRTSDKIDSLRVNKEDILVKPFMLSSLLEAIKRK